MKVVVPGCLVLLLLVTGCSPSTAYRQAEELPGIKVPGDAAFSGEEALYPVPDNGRRAQWDEQEDEFQVPPPPRVTPLEDEDDGSGDPSAAPEENTRVVLARDGSGYPIIMMHARFAWAWEYVGQALTAAGFGIDDRDRESGVFYIDLPESLHEYHQSGQIKLSHTANGIQIAVLRPDGEALMDKEPGKKVLEKLYGEL